MGGGRGKKKKQQYDTIAVIIPDFISRTIISCFGLNYCLWITLPAFIVTFDFCYNF